MKLYISTPPHIRTNKDTKRIMLDVIIALLPTTLAGIYFFGYRAAIVLAVACVTAVLAEFIWQKLAHQPVRTGDLSALVTGLILGLNLPPTAPWWLACIGSIIAIILVKQLFGGIGHNFMNPAMAARGVLIVSWPALMTAYTLPSVFPALDAVTSATILSDAQVAANYTYMDMFLGNIPGSIGEVSKAAILLGLLYMLIRGVVSWRIPVVFMGVFAALSAIFTGDALSACLTGGVLFGAVFMATDYTTSPMSRLGQFIYAAGCGLMVALIRNFGAYPEGVTFAILLMNIVTPLLDKYIKPRIYGTKGAKKNA
ncbi:MAG: RnfABCDGE type electron transport complex subunit D [Clostridia bacterium]|nr:RnfABCDGE type electron transport complex subunit D [Clostridia bacterium]